MGGKNKQSQRTKNNVRPSSSGRSAELLTSAGKFDSSMTAVGGKIMPALFPTLAGVTLDPGLDPELAMCIKKLNKKDPITKTKALQELKELVNKSSVEDVEAVLPSWSHFYKTLFVDADCKVRECTQACHGAIVRVCGRRVAPHLKQLLPSWLQAQYDDHAPAQSQAQLSLKNTFPDAKLPEVIAFCKTEILDFLEDNLIGKSAMAALSEEEENGRGSAAALHGLAWTCRYASNALHDWLWARVAKLLAKDTFWRLATHKESTVRAAWWAALGSAVERFPRALPAAAGARLLRAALGARETDARALAQLWACVLRVVHSVPNWHTWLDKKDLLLKRILNLLETGGWGDAKQLSNTLLPLLAGLPADMLTKHFYEELFKAIFKGLEMKTVINSKSERQSWIFLLSQCIRHLSDQPLEGATELCSAAHRQWLHVLCNDALMLRHSADMTDLLKFWMNKDGERYTTLVRNFWQNMGAQAQRGTERGAGAAADAARALQLLLGSVRSGYMQPARQQHSIRFDGDDPPENSPPPQHSPPSAANTELFLHQLTAATEQICATYIEIAINTRSPNIILPPLSPLLNSLSKPAVENVAKYLAADTVYGLFEKVLLPWLNDDETRCEPVMDMIFMLLEHMSEEEQDATFAAFTQEEARAGALRRALPRGAARAGAARRWLRRAPARRRAQYVCVMCRGQEEARAGALRRALPRGAARAGAARRWLRRAPARRRAQYVCVMCRGQEEARAGALRRALPRGAARAGAARRWLRRAPARRRAQYVCVMCRGQEEARAGALRRALPRGAARAGAARRWLRRAPARRRAQYVCVMCRGQEEARAGALRRALPRGAARAGAARRWLRRAPARRRAQYVCVMCRGQEEARAGALRRALPRGAARAGAARRWLRRAPARRRAQYVCVMCRGQEEARAGALRRALPRGAARAGAARRWLRRAPARRRAQYVCVMCRGQEEARAGALRRALPRGAARAGAARRWLRRAPARRRAQYVCVMCRGQEEARAGALRRALPRGAARAGAARRWLRRAPARRRAQYVCVMCRGQEEARAGALRRALPRGAARAGAARRWLRRAPARRRVLDEAEALARGAGDRQLLLMALTPLPDNEMLVGEETVSQVVDILMSSLSEGEPERVCSVLSQLACALCSRPPHNYDQLLLALLSLNLSQQRGSPQLSLESWLEARGSWQDGLHSLDTERRRALREKAAQLLLDSVHTHNTPTELNIPGIEHAASLCPYLLTDCEHAVPFSTDETAELLRQLFEAARKLLEGTASLDEFALRHDCIVSKLSCPLSDDAAAAVVRHCDSDTEPQLTEQHAIIRLTELLFRALCLRTLFLHKPDTEETSSDTEQTWCSVLLGDEYIRDEYCQLLRDYVVVDSLHEGYAFWPHYELIERTKSKLDVSLHDIITETPVTVRRQILLSLSERAAKEGYYWAYARSYYEAQVKSDDQSGDKSTDLLDIGSLDVDKLAEVVTGNGFCHSLQANLRWLPAPPPRDEPPSPPPSPPPSRALRTRYLAMVRGALCALQAERAPEDIQTAFAKDAFNIVRAGKVDTDLIVDLYYRFERVMLGDREPSSVPWQTVVCTAAVTDFLSVMAAERGWHAAPQHWDFATISLCAVISALTRPITTKTAMLCVSAVRLLSSVQTFIEALPEECMKRQPPAHVAALMNEWKDIFSPDINTNLFTFIIQLLESPPPEPMTCAQARTLSSLCACAARLQWGSLPAGARAALPLRRAAEGCARALAGGAPRGLQYLAHALGLAIADDLVLEDAEKLSSLGEHSPAAEESPERGGGRGPSLSLTYFLPHYLALLELLDAALVDIPVGEATCEMRAGARRVALGALLLADVLHAACARARGDLPHHYIQLFREQKYTELLLSSSVRLLPGAALSFSPPLADALVQLFVAGRRYSVDESESTCHSVGDVASLACRGVFHALAGPGQAGARAAWAAWGARAARALAALAAAAVAPQLLRDQFRRAARRAHTLVDTELTLLPAAREAHAVHTVEEQPLHLTISFSAEHPLTPPRVRTPRAGPAAGAHWLLVYLGYQNGDLLRAVRLWTQAVGARVERAPQCYICYCRLHPGEGLLPKVFCNQCKNKFHKSCLRKWFTTSKKSNCPVCRSAF
ncbi:E3 ubiquitin-protein ligase listerin [Amyelois transitella]|uniref:E3 ubiquitin-protein ligase listerin n=1 Tax=Amyelois transitella TaxID=680683 RepID=UPI00298FDD18|nr:E3 ubiquitin-protein ligase listerin [Amyelois transitella]